MARDWVTSKPGSQRRITKEKKTCLDTEIQHTKRQYWYKQQDEPMDSITKDQHTFWKKIGRIGVGSDRLKGPYLWNCLAVVALSSPQRKMS